MPKKPRLLVADDEEPNLLLLQRILSMDYEVDIVRDGNAVLEQLTTEEYDALLLDVMMPGMTGIEVVELIRKSTDLATLPIILISAVSDTQTIVKGITLGANDYITKPISAMIVLARVGTQITLKRLMDERKMVTAALEKTNEMKMQMMQIASHDLKTPLSNLTLLIRLIRDHSSGNPKILNYIGTINKMIANMVRIIDEFLSSKIFIDAELSEVSSLTALLDILAQYELSAKNKNIEINLDAGGDIPIFADETRIKQVISNLLSNAIKYTPLGGEIYIRTQQNGEMLRLEIQDSGPGIPADEEQYLFEAFSKSYISTQPTADENSTGLGLWIALKMVESQHGIIGLDKPEEGGCCFWIEIPLFFDEDNDTSA